MATPQFESTFPFHVYLEGDKPYTGVFKEHKYMYRFIPLAFLLTFTSGFMNAISIFDIYGYALTHLSGLTSAIAVQTAGKFNFDLAGVFALNILCYGLGACFSGFAVAHNKWTLGSHYAFIFLFEGSVMTTCTVFLAYETDFKFYCQFMICFSCGLQNGLTSTYSSNLIRTTHITGMVNDICMIIGYWIRSRQDPREFPDFWRLAFFIPIWFAFLSGGFAGLGLYYLLGPECFWFPTAMAYFWGILLLILRGFEEPRQKHVEEAVYFNKRREKENVTTPEPKMYSDAENVDLNNELELIPLHQSAPAKQHMTFFGEELNPRDPIPKGYEQKEIDTDFV